MLCRQHAWPWVFDDHTRGLEHVPLNTTYITRQKLCVLIKIFWKIIINVKNMRSNKDSIVEVYFTAPCFNLCSSSRGMCKITNIFSKNNLTHALMANVNKAAWIDFRKHDSSVVQSSSIIKPRHMNHKIIKIKKRHCTNNNKNNGENKHNLMLYKDKRNTNLPITMHKIVLNTQ